MINEDKIKDFIDDYYKKYGTTPRLKDFVKKNGFPCNKETLLKKIGNYNDFIERCGYKTYKYGQRHYNEKELLEELKRAVLQHRSVDFNFIRKDNNLKHRDIYTRVFGSVRDALNLLGIGNNEIWLLKQYSDYSLSDPILFLDEKLKLNKNEEYYQLLEEAENLKKANIPLTRDIVAQKMSIRKIYRIFGNFNNFIILSGNTVNLGNRNFIKANDGHVCDSYEEKIVDDMLSEMNIAHEVHQRYPDSKLISDFKIENIYVECTGYSRNKTNKKHDKYVKTIEDKIRLCKKLKCKIIIIENPARISKKQLAEALASDRHRIIL